MKTLTILGLLALGYFACMSSKPDPPVEPGAYGYFEFQAVDGSIVRVARETPNPCEL